MFKESVELGLAFGVAVVKAPDFEPTVATIGAHLDLSTFVLQTAQCTDESKA